MVGFGREEFVEVAHLVGMDVAVELRRPLVRQLGESGAGKPRQGKQREQCGTTHAPPVL